MINLARNIGGSVGISFVTTMLARRAQFHQSSLSAHLNPANPRVQQMLHGTAGALRGRLGSGAMQHAYALLEAQVGRQSTMLAYIDNFHVMAIVTVCLVPFVFLIKKPRRGGPIAVH